MLRVGLTGGVASGKSTVARVLAAHGAAVSDADAIVAKLYRPGEAGAEAVRGVFGPMALAADGAVDRGALAAMVLGDPAARHRLEAAIHPLVRRAVTEWFDGLEAASTTQVGVFEAALLVETGMYRRFDRLVVVSAPLAVRRERARRAGWRPERFEGLRAAQVDDEARAAVADFVIDNGDGIEALEPQVARVWSALVADLGARAAQRDRTGA